MGLEPINASEPIAIEVMKLRLLKASFSDCLIRMLQFAEILFAKVSWFNQGINFLRPFSLQFKLQSYSLNKCILKCIKKTAIWAMRHTNAYYNV